MASVRSWSRSARPMAAPVGRGGLMGQLYQDVNAKRSAQWTNARPWSCEEMSVTLALLFSIHALEEAARIQLPIYL